MKRIISLLLCVFLLIGSSVIIVSASDTEELRYYLRCYGSDMFDEDYRLTRTDDPDHEEYVIRDVWLYANRGFTIDSTYDGKNSVKAYPGSRGGFSLDTSLLIEVDGLYDIYFRPNFDGGTFYDNSGWVYGCLYVDDSKAVSEHKEYLYRDKFLEYCQTSSTRMVPYSRYDELYYHKDKSGEIDWALLEAKSNSVNNLVGTWKIGNRIINHHGFSYYPFFLNMGIYDAKTDRIYDILDINMDNYDGFTRAYDEFGEGRLVGDVDGDNKITVIDSTLIQRCGAKICDYPATDVVTETGIYAIVSYYSDFNYDGNRNLIDATCMQRYLADMSYPVG